jgi:hypothetical protein
MMMRRFTFTMAALLIGAVLRLPAWAATDEVILAWDPNTEVELAGYRLYLAEEDYDSGYRLLATIPLADIDPLAPSCTVFDLETDTRYRFVITAYNQSGAESGFSNSVCVENGGQCSVPLATGSDSGCFLSTLHPQ